MGYNDKGHKDPLMVGGAGERPAKSLLTSPVCASRLPSLVESLRPPCRHILKRGDRTVVLRLQRKFGRSVCQPCSLDTMDRTPRMALQNCSCDRTSFGGRARALYFPFYILHWQYARKMT
jgi:hypothetical protein